MKLHYPILFIVSLLLVAGCNDTPFVDEESTSTQHTFTLSASMPGSGDPSTRVAARQLPDSLDIALKWKEGDKIQLYFKSGDAITQGDEVEVQNISKDGKKADFTVEVPSDISGGFDLYGVHGTASEINSGAILLDATPGNFVKLEDARVPLYFKLENVDTGSPDQTVEFLHFGALQVITFKNTANQPITLDFLTLVLDDDDDDDDEGWFYAPTGNELPLYDVVSDSVSMVERNPVIFLPLNYNIGYDDNVKLAQWVMPNGENPPAIQFKAEINGTVKTSLSKGARTSPLVAGNAYHLYALWNGTDLTFADEADVQAYKITITTSNEDNEEIGLYINANLTDQNGVWIDLNDNGAKDDGEGVTEFVNNQDYTIASQTVTLYGKVTELTCSSNSLTALVVSNNTALTSMDCSLNRLTALDVSNNTALTSMDCSLNRLTTLDVSNNTKLTGLNCSSNSLAVLDVSNITALTYLNCYYNDLNALDVSNNTALTSLNCSCNSLESLDVSNNTALTSMDCSSISLDSLDVSNNTALVNLNCSSNSLEALDVSNNTALTHLYCQINSLDSLDLSKNTVLFSLDCSSNSLDSLDLSKNTALTNLYCSGNSLTALDVSKNTALVNLYCFDNSLKALDVSHNKALYYLACCKNKINGNAMDTLVNSLPDRIEKSQGQFRVIDLYKNPPIEENVCTKPQVNIATGKNWYVKDSRLLPYEGSDE